MQLKLNYTILEILYRKKYFSAFSRSGVIDTQTLPLAPSQCSNSSFNALHYEGCGGAGCAHNAF